MTTTTNTPHSYGYKMDRARIKTELTPLITQYGPEACYKFKTVRTHHAPSKELHRFKHTTNQPSVQPSELTI